MGLFSGITKAIGGILGGGSSKQSSTQTASNNVNLDTKPIGDGLIAVGDAIKHGDEVTATAILAQAQVNEYNATENRKLIAEVFNSVSNRITVAVLAVVGFYLYKRLK